MQCKGSDEWPPHLSSCTACHTAHPAVNPHPSTPAVHVIPLLDLQAQGQEQCNNSCSLTCWASAAVWASLPSDLVAGGVGPATWRLNFKSMFSLSLPSPARQTQQQLLELQGVLGTAPLHLLPGGLVRRAPVPQQQLRGLRGMEEAQCPLASSSWMPSGQTLSRRSWRAAAFLRLRRSWA